MEESAKSAVPQSIDLLKDSDPDVRRSASAVLGNMKNSAKSVIPYLMPLLDDSSPLVRSQTAKSLENWV